MLIELESVGTYLDTDNGLTYPANADDTPDMDNPYPLEDIEDEDEWMLALSEEDFDVVTDYLSGSVRAFPFFNLLTEK